MQNCLRKLGVKCNIYSWEVEKYKLVVDDQRRSPEMFVDKDSFLDGKCRYEKLSWTFVNVFFLKRGEMLHRLRRMDALQVIPKAA